MIIRFFLSNSRSIPLLYLFCRERLPSLLSLQSRVFLLRVYNYRFDNNRPSAGSVGRDRLNLSRLECFVLLEGHLYIPSRSRCRHAPQV